MSKSQRWMIGLGLFLLSLLMQIIRGDVVFFVKAIQQFILASLHKFRAKNTMKIKMFHKKISQFGELAR